MSSLLDFIGGAISPALPPTNPIVRRDWAGLAFDRNCHENFAPDAVWNELLRLHASNPEGQHVGVISVAALKAGKAPLFVPAALTELQGYWEKDAQFLADHYVFSPSEEWLVRLDQDVTFIAGECAFICKIVSRLGGLENVMIQMTVDFDPGADDRVGLGRYLDSITKPLRLLHEREKRDGRK